MIVVEYDAILVLSVIAPCHILDFYGGRESLQICERFGFLHQILYIQVNLREFLLLDYCECRQGGRVDDMRGVWGS